MSTTTISTFEKLNPFKGATAHTWLIFLKDFVQCLNNTGLASIIMEGKDLSGNPYLTLDDMKKKNSIEKIFIEFFNTQMAARETTSRALIVSTCYDHSPWLLNYFAAPRSLITATQTLSGQPDKSVFIPTEDQIRQAAADLHFSPTWVAESIDWLINHQQLATDADIALIHNPSPVEQSQIVDKIQSLYMRNMYINALKLNQMIMVEQNMLRDQFGDPAYQATLREVIPHILERHLLHEHEYETYANKHQADGSKTLERMRSTQEACHKAFSYVGDISTIPNASRSLSENRFFDTFRAINDHFLKIGSSDITRFESEARAHTLQFGQDLNHHIESVKASIQRWMLMELLERERLTPRLNLVASTSSAVPTHACSTSRILSLLSKDEICDANSFDQEDYRIEGAGFPILLTHRKRFDIYLNSISHSPSARFKSVADHFSRAPETELTVVRLLGMLQDFEKSSAGVQNLAAERTKHPNWYDALHSYLGALQTDVSPAINTRVAQAHVAFAGDDSAAIKICLNPRHKKMHSHVSSDCTDPIWGPLWKTYKINTKTGYPKDGSPIPPQPPKLHPAATDSAFSAVSDPAPKKKIRYDGPPCQYCLSKPDLKRIASTHSDLNCRKKDKAAQTWQKKSSSSSSSSSTDKTPKAQVAQASAPDQTALIAQLTGAVGDLVTCLKKRKHEDTEEGEE